MYCFSSSKAASVSPGKPTMKAVRKVTPGMRASNRSTRAEMEAFVPSRCMRLSNNGLDRAAALFTAHEGNRAEGAVPIAALGDLDVSGMCLTEPEPGGQFIIEIGWWADPESLGLPAGLQ